METKLSKTQIATLEHICKKGWGGFSRPSDELEEMVSYGLLTSKPGPFGDVVYCPTVKGYEYVSSNNSRK